MAALTTGVYGAGPGGAGDQRTAVAATAVGGDETDSGGGCSFRRKGPAPAPGAGGGARLRSIAGTRPSVRNGQLLVSAGLPALDQLLGGGLAVGTLLLIEEDKYNIYSNLLFKYFLAEGIVCGHTLLVASAKEDPDDIVQELPEPLQDDKYKKELDEGSSHKSHREPDISMKIAWRYQNLPKMEAGPGSSSRFGHYYDVSKRMPQEIIQCAKWHKFFLPEEITSYPNAESCALTHGYTKLLHFIQRIISEQGFDGSCPQKKQKNILRIGIQSLGSPLWGDDICCDDAPEHMHSLTRFLYVLRGLLRMSLSACIITVPSHLIQNKAIIPRVRNLSDTVVGLESFLGSEGEANSLYKDFHGLIHIHQIPRLNSLIGDVSDTKDLAFKLQRKVFTIERLHLPPDLSDTVSRSNKRDLVESAKQLSLGCGVTAGGKDHLDF
ncbi:LOW QUALITY PROTEIN: elongator complex protein 4 [Dromiciops gliroides]|uniref:LOW QUALITY PROTEIN: elongator complex protein 4 n=1 Tax=Dromiciops gliroides TaxID=33562 RepID=UPI001CC684A8|nr:LOW QUALITY PROTEIN: elongator complex protein 4 [Dromiciops gliroides]